MTKKEAVIKETTIKVLVQGYTDREKMITALANSGYPVWVEEETKHHCTASRCFVCFETDRGDND